MVSKASARRCGSGSRRFSACGVIDLIQNPGSDKEWMTTREKLQITGLLVGEYWAGSSEEVP